MSRIPEPQSKLHFGWSIESKAADWYLSRTSGAILLARNFRCRIGEIDLIFEEPVEGPGGGVRRELVFVEVRARLAGASWETGLESVGYTKQRKLVRTIEWYLARYRGKASGVRLDVLAWDGGAFAHSRNLWGFAGQT